MADVHTQKIRSKNMSSIKCSDTSPELKVRRVIHSLGFRFSLRSKLFGKPDLVLPRYNKVIFVHGCFWHLHNCHLFKMPGTNISFWKSKFSKNKTRDKTVEKRLRNSGWSILKIWECALKGKNKLQLRQLESQIRKYIISENHAEIRGITAAS